MKISKILVIFLFVLFLSLAYSSGVRDSAPPEESAKYIEVCTNGLVYLPPGTKYVTCQGRVMRVLYIGPLMEQIETIDDCDCPKCCGGLCGITVLCESDPDPSTGKSDCGGCGVRTSAGGGLCTAYLACGD